MTRFYFSYVRIKNLLLSFLVSDTYATLFQCVYLLNNLNTRQESPFRVPQSSHKVKFYSQSFVLDLAIQSSRGRVPVDASATPVFDVHRKIVTSGNSTERTKTGWNRPRSSQWGLRDSDEDVGSQWRSQLPWRFVVKRFLSGAEDSKMSLTERMVEFVVNFLRQSYMTLFPHCYKREPPTLVVIFDDERLNPRSKGNHLRYFTLI